MANNSQYWPKPPQPILNIVPSEEVGNGGFSFYLKSDGKLLGNCSITKIADGLYDLGGVYVDLSLRKSGLGSRLVQMVNKKLEQLNSNGTLVAVDNSEALYEKNGWVKGEYVSQNGRGGYKMSYTVKSK